MSDPWDSPELRDVAAELSRRDLNIEFRGTRDTDAGLLLEDLEWLRDRVL